MELNYNPIRVTSAFYITPSLKSIVVEHSDLGRVSILNRLYDDACDVGVVLYNPFTNRTTRWYLHEEKRDSEGDLQVTIYKPCPETERKYPGIKGWEFHILND